MNTTLKTKKFISGLPFLTLLIMAFSVCVSRCYPFSTFSMYSNLQSQAKYFYVADQDGKPIATKEIFGFGPQTLSVMHKNNRNLILSQSGQLEKFTDVDMLAAQNTLDELIKETDKDRLKGFEGLRLYQQIVYMQENKIFRYNKMVAYKNFL